ncbi:hypothetical protein [Vibrio sp. SCSIO 43136]|uniref:hypothetical protein n=1 Tax=Vibrio sp. SCSIO 43136 TaxID=2819101 RepID=UPI002075E848|nr:hypothetical protein [Vibrio sp. SCSIO 43136]USD66335.1 hypothetical protein J4N39_05830 [Vibrio sp. SCSIO 43136]
MKAFFEVYLRLVITVWVILLAVLSLLYLMNYMKFDSLMSQVVSSKLEVITSSIHNSIQRSERLGIPVASATNLRNEFDTALAREPDVMSVSYIDATGNTVLQAVANNATASEIPQDVIRRALNSNEANWLFSDDDALYSGLQHYNGFDVLAGSIVVEYDKSALFGIYSLVQLHLLEASVVIFLTSCLVVFLVVRFGFGDIANVIKLIQGYSKRQDLTQSANDSGEISHRLADQIKQSEQMKDKVSGELDALQGMQSKTEASRCEK